MDPKNDPSKTDPTPDPEPAPKPEPAPEPEPEPEPLDKNGNPGINREKYQRDIEARDAKIADLQAKLDEAAKTEEGRAELQRQLDEFKAEADSAKTDLALERAGCTDPKKADAARALLAGYGGDVASLKADHPYLFDDKQQRQTGTTGGKPGGAPDPSDERRQKARRAAGLVK
ncbi:MAG: hypothetical protein IJ111_13625 [Eggerthellaceae bacterium]|nr:hypothetical protein [Eggerthellaceae bacterium]